MIQCNRRLDVTLAELLVIVPIAAAASIITAVYSFDALGWRLNWTQIALVLLIEVAVVGVAVYRFRPSWQFRVDWPVLIGVFAVLGGLIAYLMWLSGPSLLPPTESSDLVHHLSLIRYLQQRQSLVHDPALAKYLVEFVIHPAGSHSLSAFAAGLLGTTGLRVIYPVVMAAVVSKSGMVYLIALRLLPPARRNPALAAVASVALLLSWSYFFVPFAAHFYYGQTISEMFVIGMLWLIVRFDDQPSTGWLLLFGWLGAGVALSWTAWLPIPFMTLLLMILLARGVSFRRKLVWAGVASLPTGVFLGLYVFGYMLRNELSIFLYEGSTVRPSIESFGPVLVILAAFGLIASWRNRAVRPVKLFALAGFAQFVALFVAALLGKVSFYLGLKMLHILIYPLAVLAALAVDGVWSLAARQWSVSVQQRWSRVAVIAPLLLIVIAARASLPLNRPPSVVSVPLYEAGQWAKANLPNDCIDYVVDHWVTAYWLHVAVLGNPILSPHTEKIVSDWQYTQHVHTRWAESPGLPYAIVADLDWARATIGVPFDVVAEFGAAAVIARRSASQCDYHDLPFEQLPIETRP